MAFEPLIIENWIYSTLKADNTLMGLLAGVNNKSPNFQIGIYSTMAPEKDPFSKKLPQLPYVVFNRAGSLEDDEEAMCGDTFTSRPLYMVNVWNSANGSISYNTIKSSADRVDLLLNNQTVTQSGITFKCVRINTEMPIQVEIDGKIDFALSFQYKFLIVK